MVKADASTTYKQTLDRYYEADTLDVASGTPLEPGTGEKIFTIPDGETWCIEEFGGSTSVDQCEVELLFSSDGGSTWGHPCPLCDSSKIRCIHLSSGVPGSVKFLNVMPLTGSGTNIKLKILCKNWNQTEQAEIEAWINGWVQ